MRTYHFSNKRVNVLCFGIMFISVKIINICDTITKRKKNTFFKQNIALTNQVVIYYWKFCCILLFYRIWFRHNKLQVILLIKAKHDFDLIPFFHHNLLWSTKEFVCMCDIHSGGLNYCIIHLLNVLTYRCYLEVKSI